MPGLLSLAFIAALIYVMIMVIFVWPNEFKRLQAKYEALAAEIEALKTMREEKAERCIFCGAADDLITYEGKKICESCRNRLAAQKNLIKKEPGDGRNAE